MNNQIKSELWSYAHGVEIGERALAKLQKSKKWSHLTLKAYYVATASCGRRMMYVLSFFDGRRKPSYLPFRGA